MRLILLMLVVVHVCFSSEIYRVPVFIQNHQLVVDISLNRQDNSMIVSTSTSNLPRDFLPTANYHDFNTSMKAFKSIDSGECYIMQTSETIGMVDQVLDNIIRHNFQQHPIEQCSKADNHLLSDAEVESIAGRRIRDFCSGYKSYTSKRVRREASSLTENQDDHIVIGQHNLFCFLCLRSSSC
ncbi:uncharacterized protein LOC134719509 [Mytilus trossulus]|uniref:uncharacterized protein LOC134719509 n=1 Tax=Mytilus trossulus TaxID=6551 RepID=UPI0030056153